MTSTVHAPELSQLRLGYIPLTDAAPLVVARERGYFERHGLAVRLSRQPSWATLRDKLAIGQIDGAHLLAPMALACSVGVEGVGQALVTALSMGLNGNAITVADWLYREMQEAARGQPVTAASLAGVVSRRRAAGTEPLTFASVYPLSNHTYQLRYWLTAGGVDPDRDIRLAVAPPPQMVQRLRAGSIDGYCVGAPWNTLAVQQGVGRIVSTGYEVWNNAPEKVLAVGAAWAQRYPATHAALVCAIVEAAQWLDESPQHRLQAAELLARETYLDLPFEAVACSLLGRLPTDASGTARELPDFHVFYRYAATFPWRSHALWMLAQMQRCGQLPRDTTLSAVAQRVYRPDLYRLAVARLGIPVPAIDHKTEGHHGAGWVLGAGANRVEMGADRFIDGALFDPLIYGSETPIASAVQLRGASRF